MKDLRARNGPSLLAMPIANSVGTDGNMLVQKKFFIVNTKFNLKEDPE